MRVLRIASIGSVTAAALAACVLASPAQADWGDGYYHRWHPHDGWDRPGGPPALIVAPPPYRMRPAAYYAPPPVAYLPPPAVDAPDVVFGLTIR